MAVGFEWEGTPTVVGREGSERAGIAMDRGKYPPRGWMPRLAEGDICR